MDNRRVSDVKQREQPASIDEDYSLDNYKNRLTRRNLTELLGQEGMEEHMRNRAAWRKKWGS